MSCTNTRLEFARGRRTARLWLDELTAAEAAHVLKRYVQQVGMLVRPFFDAGRDDPVEAFAAEAAQHPVFRLTSASNPAQARLNSGETYARAPGCEIDEALDRDETGRVRRQMSSGAFGLSRRYAHPPRKTTPATIAAGTAR